MWGWSHVMYTWWLWHWMSGLGWRMFPTGSCVQTAGVTVWRRYRMFNVRGPGWQSGYQRGFFGSYQPALLLVLFSSCRLANEKAAGPPHIHSVTDGSFLSHSHCLVLPAIMNWSQGLKYTSPPSAGSVRSSVTLMRKTRTNITNKKIKT